jgi:signal transduction histidine kinase
LENAVRHSPPGATVRIVVGADEDFVTTRVQDAGPGVSEDEREKVFERFYRGRRAAEGRLGGVGLGLAIAREIVLRHGGSIGVEGSTFYFKLPRSASTSPNGTRTRPA